MYINLAKTWDWGPKILVKLEVRLCSVRVYSARILSDFLVFSLGMESRMKKVCILSKTFGRYFHFYPNSFILNYRTLFFSKS